MDFTKLKLFLETEKWQNADEETTTILLLLANRQQQKWLRGEDLQKLSSLELKKIDRLWLQYSQEKFGFSVILNIYKSCDKNYYQLSEKVGWRNEGIWLEEKQIITNLNLKKGQFPFQFRKLASQTNHISLTSSKWIEIFMKKIEESQD